MTQQIQLIFLMYNKMNWNVDNGDKKIHIYRVILYTLAT